MQNPLARCAVAEETKCHVVLVAVLVCESNTCSQTNLSTDNSVPSKQVALLVKHVHGTAFALARSRFLAKHLGHDVLGVSPEHERVRMVAVSGDHTVRGADASHMPESTASCPMYRWQKPPIFVDVQLAAAFLKLAHEVHFAEPARVSVFIQALCRLLGSGLASSFGGLFGRRCRCRL